MITQASRERDAPDVQDEINEAERLRAERKARRWAKKAKRKA